MTRATGFWGLVVEPTKLYSQQVPSSFKITMASLGSNKELNDSSSSSVKAQRTSLIFNLDNKDDFTLCSLTLEKVEQQPLDLVLTEGEIISFRVEGNHPIHLSGYYLDDDENDGFGDEDDEGMYSDEAEEDSQIEYDSEDLDSEDFDDSEDESVNLENEQKNPRIRVVETDEDEEEDSEMDENDSEISEDENSELEEESEEESKQSAKRSVKFDLPETKKTKEIVTPVASPAKVSPAAVKVSSASVTAKVTPPPATPKQVTPVAKPTPEEIKIAAPVKKTLPSGLQIEDLKLGSGAKVNQGKSVLISYKGTLLNGKVFDSNFGGKPLKFKVGKGEVIKGMDIGIVGMAVGGSRKLVIPSPLAYGKQAQSGIPRDSTLIFEIRLEKIL